jgi:hypothetical protein
MEDNWFYAPRDPPVIKQRELGGYSWRDKQPGDSAHYKPFDVLPIKELIDEAEHPSAD